MHAVFNVWIITEDKHPSKLGVTSSLKKLWNSDNVEHGNKDYSLKGSLACHRDLQL